MKEKVIFYKDELNDEFSSARIKAKTIDEDYDYNGKKGRKILRFFTYRLIAIPIAYVYLKIFWQLKIVGREKLEGFDEGVFLYGNHTNAICDALIPTMILLPKGTYVIVHPDNVSMPFLGHFTPSLGAIPLPDNMKAMKNFKNEIDAKAEAKENITIYPEAHIWPFYTHIRPFRADSFTYPYKLGKPVFCFTNTYHKGSFFRKKIVTYVEGPFFADESLSVKEGREKLREDVYAKMVENSKHNEVEYIKYVKREEQ